MEKSFRIWFWSRLCRAFHLWSGKIVDDYKPLKIASTLCSPTRSIKILHIALWEANTTYK